MVQSALPDEWRDCATEGYCYLRNVHDKMADDKTAPEKTTGVTFDGPLIPCVANVGYEPISSKDEARLHHFGKQVLPESSWRMY